MEKLKAKHDHKLTDILKVGIFALFLLMPFLTFMPTALYYGFNEHAVNEKTTEVNINYKYQSNEVNSLDDLVVGNIYSLDYLHMEYDYDDEFEFRIISCESIDFIHADDTFVNDYNVSDYLNSNFSYINVLNTQNTLILKFVLSDETYTEIYFDGNFELGFNNLIFYMFYDDYTDKILEYFTLTHQNIPQYTDYNVIESVDVQENVELTISQQMYNSWQTMWQSPFYNWTNNSILKNGLDNFTSVLGINNTSYFTNLLTYELIIIVIYIVLDIVLTLFTWLTHLFNSKE